MSKKDLLRLDEELAFKQQAEEEEEERLAKEKAQQIKELREQKKRGTDHQQELNKGVSSMKRVHTFVDYITELVEKSSKKAEIEHEESSKKAEAEIA
ncbi:hypothetical protein Tco_0540732 [Tanacetum coccineum]